MYKLKSIRYNTILIIYIEIISFIFVFTSIQCSATFFDFNNCIKLVNSLLLSLLTDFIAYSITSLLASSSGIFFSMSSLIFLKKKKKIKQFKTNITFNCLISDVL